MRRLPQGRGLRKDADPLLNQAEADRFRAGLLPEAKGWVISPAGDAVYSSVGATDATYTASRLNIYYLPERFLSYKLEKASIRVTLGDAGSTARSCLYYLDGRTFMKLPGSEVTYDTASAARLDQSLSAPVEVDPTMRLFLGWWVSSAVPTFDHYEHDTSVARYLRINNISPPLPAKIEYSEVGTVGTPGPPAILYMSLEGSDFLV